MKHAHRIVLSLCVAALCVFAHGCKSDYGSTPFEEALSMIWGFVSGVIAVATGEWVLPVTFAVLGFFGLKFFMPRHPLEVHGTQEPIPGAPGNPPPHTPGLELFGFVLPWWFVGALVVVFLYFRWHKILNAWRLRTVAAWVEVFLPKRTVVPKRKA